jgi:beta-lactamase regulating signal transducer with metallopeptidase domain
MNPWESLLSASNHKFVLLSAAAGVGVSMIALVGGRLLRRQSASARYGVLFVGVLGMLASPVLVAIGPMCGDWTAVPITETVRIPAERLTGAMASKATEPAPSYAPGSGILAWIAAAFGGVWLVGIAAGLIALVRGHWKLRKTLVGEPWQRAWWTDERRADLAATIGLARFPPVRQSPFAPFPMVVGLRRPTIVLPAAAPESWTSSQWEAVLLHEAAHIARRDPLSTLVQAAAVTLYWWWPVAHLLSRRIHDLRETICDDFALEGACDPVAYAELLVQAAERLVNLRTLPAAVGLLDSAHGGLKERITRLLTKEKRSMTRLSLAVKLFGPAAMLLACLTITAASGYSQAPPPQRNIQIKILIDGKELDLNDEAVQALLARQKSAAAAPTSAVWNVLRAVEGVAVDDPRVDQLVRQAEAIKPGAGEAVRKLLVERRSFNYWIVAAPKQPAEIEELAKRAEALAPGAGAKIRILLTDGRQVLATSTTPVLSGPALSPPHPEANRMGAARLFIYDAADGKRVTLGLEGPKVPQAQLNLNMLYDLKKAKSIAASGGPAPGGTASGGSPAVPSKDSKDVRSVTQALVAELALKSAELKRLSLEVERLNAEALLLRQHFDRATGQPRPGQQPIEPPGTRNVPQSK